MIHKLTATVLIGQPKGEWQEVDVSQSIKDVVVGTKANKPSIKPNKFVMRTGGVQKFYGVTTDDSTEDGLDAELFTTTKKNDPESDETFKFAYPRFYMLISTLAEEGRLIEADSIVPFAEEY